MELHWLRPLLGRPAPFTTIYLDGTRADSAGEDEVADRWRGVRRDLERQGASSAVLDAIGDALAVPSATRGPHGRVVIADAETVLVDRVLAEPPAQSRASFGTVPDLLPAARAGDEIVHRLVVAVDRNGADLTWHGHESGDAGDLPDRESVDGGHDDVHKVRDGGLDRGGQTRAEDSWQRNAEAVATELDRRVADRHPELVLLTGDVRAVAMVRDAVGQPVRDLLVEVPGGGRGDGVHQGAFEAHLTEAVDAYRARRRGRVLDRFAEQQGRGEGTVTAMADVLDVLRRGQVAELVLRLEPGGGTGALQETTLWVGPDPLQIGADRAALAAIGVGDDAQELRADVALLRAAIGQDAGLTVVEDERARGDRSPDGAAGAAGAAGPDGATGSPRGSALPDLVDGVGALLRWTDESTPSESLASQTGDQARLRSVV